MEEPIHKLKFRLIETTSEDFDFPLYELMKGMSESAGWLSSRFCTYPQEILIQFIQPVRLRQLNILINEKKIPSMIEFYYFYPQTSDDYYTNYKKLLFDKVGYVRMDTNSRTNYKARELRKVFIDLPCLYIKLVIHKNYVNKFNIFNQVGIVGLEFFGLALQPIIHNKDFYLKESVKENVVNDEDLDDLSLEKLRILKQKQEEAIKVEDYDEAKKIKKVIDRTKMIGKKIREYEDNKKIYINNEDFDNAKIMKLEIERLKSNLKYIDKQPGALVPYHNTSLEINKSEFEENKDNNYKEAKDLKENKEISINFNNDEM